MSIPGLSQGLLAELLTLLLEALLLSLSLPPCLISINKSDTHKTIKYTSRTNSCLLHKSATPKNYKYSGEPNSLVLIAHSPSRSTWQLNFQTPL